MLEDTVLVGTCTVVRYVEAKGRGTMGEVALTNNEFKTAERLGPDYWLYVVYNCTTTPQIHAVSYLPNHKRLGLSLALPARRPVPETIG